MSGPAPEHPPDDACTLVYAHSIESAHAIKSILDAANIRAFVVGDLGRGLYLKGASPYSINVLIPRSRYNEAVQVLHAAAKRAGEAGSLPIQRCHVCGYDMEGLKDKPLCPECGAEVIKYAELSRFMTLAPPPGDTPLFARMVSVLGMLVLAAVVVGGLVALGVLLFG